MTKIYRFISFEVFIDMLIRKSLTFVHPTAWDDPYELKLLENNLKQIIGSSSSIADEGTLGAILEHIISKKLYCQSWTKLNESDALWRIYNHHNTSVRIETDLNKISKLEGVEAIEVNYVDDLDITSTDSFYGMIVTKREVFSHEREIRLVTHYKFSGKEDVVEYSNDFLKLSGDSRLFNKFEIYEIDEGIDRIISKLNYTIEDKTTQINYGHIENFIESVMLNPFAPSWFEDTLRMVCEVFDIKFLGKSKIYKLNE
ncbi:hypothetical protein [Tumebacillus lipolyticus]|uniref:DUF2971 domain-containing protein n=1 Tax=Tumebacillus lipolyticus TaxID=1280370 RepID=A0ABW4ZSW5_9BACL